MCCSSSFARYVAMCFWPVFSKEADIFHLLHLTAGRRNGQSEKHVTIIFRPMQTKDLVPHSGHGHFFHREINGFDHIRV